MKLEDLRSRCIDQLSLAHISWDAALELQHDRLIASIERLCSANIADNDRVSAFAGLSLKISTSPNPFICTNGTISIPLDWK